MRQFLITFESEFEAIHRGTLVLLQNTTDADLYRRPRELPRTFTMFTIGEYVLRSAATIEQTFGGITTRLWDDPFEWTLPEKLDMVDRVAEYLEEVAITRRRGLDFFQSDEDLRKHIPAPSEIRSIFEVLLETVSRARHFQGRAFAVLQMLSDEKLPNP